jgi:uncharacterized membrane protein
MSKQKKSKQSPPATTQSGLPQSGPQPVDSFERLFMSQLPVGMVQTYNEHSGPLPPPAMLKEYEKLIPNASERLLALVEREQQQRHENLSQLIKTATEDAEASRRAHLRGDIIALVFFFSCFAGGFYLLLNSFPAWIAAPLLGAPLIASLSMFLIRRKGIPDKETSENQKLPSQPE